MSRPKQAHYYACYGIDWIRAFQGTKQAVVNRLKRASYVQMVDSLVIYPVSENDEVDFDHPVWGTCLEGGDCATPNYNPDFFTETELSMIFNW